MTIVAEASSGRVRRTAPAAPRHPVPRHVMDLDRALAFSRYADRALRRGARASRRAHRDARRAVRLDRRRRAARRARRRRRSRRARGGRARAAPARVPAHDAARPHRARDARRSRAGRQHARRARASRRRRRARASAGRGARRAASARRPGCRRRSSSSAWASSAAASSTCRPTSTSSSSIPRKARPTARSASPTASSSIGSASASIAAISHVDADGYVFRVDMRLRPYGESGPLTVSFAALEQYLVDAGARVGALRVAEGAAADRRAARRARGARHAVRLSQVPRLRRLRGAARHPSADPRAGEAPRLRAGHQARRRRHPRDRVRRAGAADRARRPRAGAARSPARCRRSRRSRSAARSRRTRRACCATATLFLRMLEHRLQYRDDRQTQIVPADAERARAGREALDCAERAAFDERLDAHRDSDRAAVQRRVRRARRRPTQSSDADAALRARCGTIRATAPTPSPSSPTPASTIRAGLVDTLARMRAEPTLSAVAGAVARSLRRAGAAAARRRGRASQPAGAAPDAVVQRLLGLLEAVSRRSAYLALLIEHPPLLPRLAQLMGASAWAADYLTRSRCCSTSCSTRACCSPNRTGTRGAPSSIALLAPHADDAERQMDALRHFQHAQTFRLLAQDLAGQLTSSGWPTICRRWPTRFSPRRSPAAGRNCASARRRRRRASRSSATASSAARSSATRRTSTSSSSTSDRRRDATAPPSATRASRSASTRGSPARRPRDGCTRPTCGCVPTAPPACSCRASPRSRATSASRRGRGSTRR